MINKTELSETNCFDFIFLKLFRFIMVDGKKQTAQNILKKSLLRATNTLSQQDEKKVLVTAIFNVSPDIEIKSKRIGSTSYQIPRPITLDKKINLGIKLLLQACKSRKEKNIESKLASELVDAYNNKGLAVKKKDEIHKLAESNKSLAHFSW